MSAADGIVVSLATLVAREGRRDDLRRALLALIEPTRAEQGNLDYVLFEMVDAPGTFIMREAFASMAALREHQATAHYAAFGARSDELLAEPLTLTFLTPVSD